MKPLALNDLISRELIAGQAILRVTNISSSLDEYSEPFVTAHCIDNPTQEPIGNPEPTENTLEKNFFADADKAILLYEDNTLRKGFPFYRLVADACEAKDNLTDLIEYIELLEEEPEENQEEIALYSEGIEHFNEQYDKLRTQLALKLAQ